MKRYQIVYSLDENNNIVFVGKTHLSIDDLLSYCEGMLDITVSLKIVAVSYEPIKEENDEQEKS